MKKTTISALTLTMLLSLLLTSCDGTTRESSAPSPVKPTESASTLEAPVSSPEDSQLVLNWQMDEIQRAIEPIAPARKLENDAERERIGQQITDAIAGLGYPVVQYHRDMPNYEKVTAFFERVDRGGNAFVTVYSFRVYETVSVNGTLYGKDETGFYEQGASISQDENFAWTKNIYDSRRLKSLELTANGNLMENADEQGNGYGFRVVPEPKAYTDAYWKYVWLIDVQADGVLSSSWNREAGFYELPWDLIFEEIWERENRAFLVAKGNPYYTDITTGHGADQAAIVPADVVEGTLQKYFILQLAIYLDKSSPILYNYIR